MKKTVFEEESFSITYLFLDELGRNRSGNSWRFGEYGAEISEQQLPLTFGADLRATEKKKKLGKQEREIEELFLES